MFKCIKDWFMGNSPDYKGMAGKMADQIYHDECSVIGKNSRTTPDAIDSSKIERKGVFLMAEDLVETKPPGENKADGNIHALPMITSLPKDTAPPLVDVSTPTPRDNDYKLIKVMWFQYRHDQTYHSDIANMPVMQRLGHLNNHLVKYITKYIKFSITSTYAGVEVVDGIICCISALSSLHYNPQDLTIPEFFVKQRVMPIEETMMEVGRISKILEGWDHLEDIDYRAELKESFCVVLASLLNIYYNNVGGCFVTEAYTPRLNGIKKKHPFHEFFLEEGRALMDVQRIVDPKRLEGFKEYQP